MDERGKGLGYLACEGEGMGECLSELAPLRQRAILKRTFNQKIYNESLEVVGIIKFWRVIGPASHRSYQSDLSLEGLRDWGIMP